MAGAVRGAQVHVPHHVDHVIVGAGADGACGLGMPLRVEAGGHGGALRAGCLLPEAIEALPGQAHVSGPAVLSEAACPDGMCTGQLMAWGLVVEQLTQWDLTLLLLLRLLHRL